MRFLFSDAVQGDNCVALIPLSLYFKDSRVKVELGLCKGKKLHDKRDSEAERQTRRDIDRIMKEKNYE